MYIYSYIHVAYFLQHSLHASRIKTDLMHSAYACQAISLRQ